MKVKKYTAPTLKDALLQIRQEMGAEALIISTKKKTGTFGKSFVEVTAASGDTGLTPTAERVQTVDAPNLEEQIVRNRVILSESLKPVRNELFQIRNMVDKLQQMGNNVDLAPLREDVQSLRGMVSALTRHSDFIHKLNFTEPLKNLFYQLLDSGVEENLSLQLIEMLDTRMDEDSKKDESRARAELKRLIIDSVTNSKPVTLADGQPTVMAFVGPTGVGKTTTIAKLAARCTLQMKKKVCLITVDTYRIAAVEQLKTYAKIMALPIFVCYSSKEMMETLEENRDSALILIDTAGRSQTDTEQIDDLKDYFAEHSSIEKLLVLSATTKTSDLRDVTDRFSRVKASKLVFTKLDETKTYGSVLNEAVRTGLPIAYFAAGQNVPDDIESASPSKLANLILGDG